MAKVEEVKSLVILSKVQITKKYDVSTKYIADMKKLADELVIKDVDDKDGYDNVHTGLKGIKAKRIACGVTKKELKAPYLQVNDDIETEYKRLVGLIKPIEDSLAEKKKVIDDKKELIKEEKRQAKQKIFNDRMETLHQLNHVEFNGTVFFLNNFSVAVVDIGVLSDKEYDIKLKELTDVSLRVSEEKQREAHAKAEQERKDKAELDKLRKEKKEKDDELEELRKFKEELELKEKLEKEAEEMIESPNPSYSKAEKKDFDGGVDTSVTTKEFNDDADLKATELEWITFKLEIKYDVGDFIPTLAKTLKKELKTDQLKQLKKLL